MAGVKITDLNELIASTVGDSDQLVIVDFDADETKRIRFSELLAAKDSVDRATDANNADTATTALFANEADIAKRLQAASAQDLTHYILMRQDGTDGADSANYADDLTYDPTGTGTLTTGTFSGNLTGNADTATTATTANQAIEVSMRDAQNSTDNFKVLFSPVTATGYDSVYFEPDNSTGAFFRPSDGTLTVSRISTPSNTGPLYGIASGAETIENVSTSTDAGFYLLFAGSQDARDSTNTASTLTFNPFSGTLSATTFSGSFSGDGSGLTGVGTDTSDGKVNDAANETTGTSEYVMFRSSATGLDSTNTNANLRFNASNGTLSATTFSGALSGNATTATSATDATNADNVDVGTASGVQYLALATTTGNTGIDINTNLSYSSTDSTLTVGNILPRTDLTYDLGSSTRRWNDLYLSGATIYLGDSAVLSASGTVVQVGGTNLATTSDAETYTADSAGLWNGSAPSTIDSAIDRIAILVKSLNGGTGA